MAGKSLFDVVATINAKDFVRYMKNVSDDIDAKVEKEIPEIRSKTRKIVRNNLKKNNGVNTGRYKKNIVIRNLASHPGEIHFQVGGAKMSYRLTHLLEHGHRIKVHGKFVAKKNGGVLTKSIPHIKPGQDFADEKVIDLYRRAIIMAFGKAKK